MNKRLLFKVIFFLLPLFIFLVAIELMLRNIPNDYSYKRKYLDENAEKIQVLFLGNSHISYDINPAFIQLRSFKASHGSQTIDYDYMLIEKYSTKFKNLKYLVIPIDYFTLFTRFSDGWEENRIKNYNIYYGMHQGFKISYYFEILNNKFSANISRIIRFYTNSISHKYCNNLGKSFNDNYPIQKEMIDNGSFRAFVQHSINNKNVSSSIVIIDSILRYTNCKNIKLIFITMPAHKSYVKHLDKYQIATTVNIADSVSKMNKNVAYYNFLIDTSFHTEDFFDSDHLNEKGAEKFSLKVNQLLH